MVFPVVNSRLGLFALAISSLLCGGAAQAEEKPPRAHHLTASEQMDAHVPPFDQWAFAQVYTPAMVSMRVSEKVHLAVHDFVEHNDWLKGPFLTGTWGGLRRDLFNLGIDLKAGYVGNPFWNPIGGTREALRWHHQLNASLLLDFERMAGLKGAAFYIQGRWRGGSFLSDPVSGVGITGLYEPSAYVGSEEERLGEMYWRQQWLDGRVELRLGRLAASYPFADNPITYIFVNDAINANIDGVTSNIPFSSGDTTWGAFLRTWPLEDLYVQAGVYNDPIGVGDAENHGVGFSLRASDGVIAVAELGWDPTERGMTSLPGSYIFGGYYATSDQYLNYTTRQAAEGIWGLYAAGTQMIWREKPDSNVQGLSVFVTASGATPEENQVQFYTSAGAVYVGPIPGRPHDQVALAMAYTSYSPDYSSYLQRTGGAGLNSQTVVELTYAISVTPFIVVQPDIQYFFDPAANGTVPDTLVVGAQIAVAF